MLHKRVLFAYTKFFETVFVNSKVIHGCVEADKTLLILLQYCNSASPYFMSI